MFTPSLTPLWCNFLFLLKFSIKIFYLEEQRGKERAFTRGGKTGGQILTQGAFVTVIVFFRRPVVEARLVGRPREDGHGRDVVVLALAPTLLLFRVNHVLGPMQ
jgi:hypothetical protein